MGGKWFDYLFTGEEQAKIAERGDTGKAAEAPAAQPMPATSSAGTSTGLHPERPAPAPRSYAPEANTFLKHSGETSATPGIQTESFSEIYKIADLRTPA